MGIPSTTPVTAVIDDCDACETASGPVVKPSA
jgi:hypothetical protein